MKNSKVKVQVRKGDIGKALKFFKNKVMTSEHLKEFRERQEFLKPSVKKRIQMNRAKREMKFNTEND